MARSLKDAFYDSQYRVGQGIYTRAVSQGDNSLTESNFTSHETFDSLVADETGAWAEFFASDISFNDVIGSSVGFGKIADVQHAMNDVAGSQTAMDAVSSSQTAMDAVSSSQTAMDAVAASQTARDVIGFSGLAYDTIAASNMAIGKYAIGYTTESPADYADMDAVAASQTAMDAVAASQTAMDAVAGSQTAMDAVAGSQTARGSIRNSATAVSTLNDLTTDVVSGELIGDGGPSSGGTPVYERSQGTYIQTIEQTGSNSGTLTIWVDYGDEVVSYDFNSSPASLTVERIAFAVYHEQQYDNTGIDVIQGYEW